MTVEPVTELGRGTGTSAPVATRRPTSSIGRPPTCTPTEAYPHYPPSHYYPPKPRRPKRQKQDYRHTPTGASDIQPGTWTSRRATADVPGWPLAYPRGQRGLG